MLIELNLDEKIVAKIKELLESGTYSDQKELIINAIENLYERTQAANGSSEQVGYLYADQQEIFARDLIIENKDLAKEVNDYQNRNGPILESRLDAGKLYQILDNPDDVNHRCIVPKPEMIYGNEYAGLIWVFHNRFLPIKFILTVLAKLIVETENKWIDLEELKTEVSSDTRYFTDMLSKMNLELDIKPAVGFPRTSDDFEKTPKLKKMRKGRRKAKASELEATSNNRFLDQFVGRELTKKSSRRLAGACAEMGLMDAGSDDENSKLKVTLSELGKEFVGLDWTKSTETYNQIFDQIWNPEKRGVTPIKNIFSKLEVDFIMEKIIPQFELEYIIVKEFLGLSQETSVDTITDIFLNKQKLYLEQKDAEAYNKIKEKLEKNPLARATTVMTKLVELGKVKRIKRGLSVFYIANST